MGMSLEEIVFLFTVSGLPWPPSRSVSASLHLYGGGGGGKASVFLEPGVSHSVLKVLSARRDASPGFVSLPPVSTSGCTPFVFCRGILHSGVDPGSVGVHAHLYVSEPAAMYASPPPSLKWISLWSSARSSRTIAK